MKRNLIAVVMVSALTTGCAHTEAEWQAELDRHKQVETAQAAHAAELDAQIAAERQRVADLEKQLHASGLETTKLSTNLADKERALAEYKARAQKLEQIKARYDLLRGKLEALTKLGHIDVIIRKNRMVISLPGDVVFDTGKDTVSKKGEDILRQVASVIRHDRSLMERDYQVAGHTDNQPLAHGPYHDNWGLSVMRARSVLLYLVGKGGGLPRQHWSAAGFADTDPVANNATNDGRQKNRRCDLVIVPDADELIDLHAIASR